jgi:dephospho-CoA kinase
MMELPTVKVYGLTGAPGCGKSTVLKLFSDLGRYTLDADSLCASIHNTPGGTFHEKIRERWGDSVLKSDGTTDKQKLAGIVFTDPEELSWLEGELYPAMTEQAACFFRSLPDDSVAIFEIPLLFERNWNIGLAGTIAVWSPLQIQHKRLTERGWSEEESARRCAAQFSADKKLELADYGIINDDSMEKLKQQCIYLNNNVFSIR